MQDSGVAISLHGISSDILPLYGETKKIGRSLWYINIRQRQGKQANVSLCLATHFRLCSTSKHFAKHTPNSKPKKSEQDCFQHHKIRARFCHEISDKNKENTERNNSWAVSSHSSSTPHGTANPLVNSIPLVTACLLLLIARRETARGYVLRTHIIGQASL
jgi:hypothetical protein